jgi:hypothetical protein
MWVSVNHFYPISTHPVEVPVEGSASADRFVPRCQTESYEQCQHGP